MWQHIACVANDVDIRVYIDGLLDCTPGAHTTGVSDEAEAFQVGMDRGVTMASEFDGLIDEVAVFATNDGSGGALTASEVLDIKTNGLDGSKGVND